MRSSSAVALDPAEVVVADEAAVVEDRAEQRTDAGHLVARGPSRRRCGAGRRTPSGARRGSRRHTLGRANPDIPPTFGQSTARSGDRTAHFPRAPSGEPAPADRRLSRRAAARCPDGLLRGRSRRRRRDPLPAAPRSTPATAAGIVTGDGERVLVIGDSWSVGLGQDDLAELLGLAAARARCTSPGSPGPASAPTRACAAASPSTTAPPPPCRRGRRWSSSRAGSTTTTSPPPRSTAASAT